VRRSSNDWIASSQELLAMTVWIHFPFLTKKS
jgi:hypothetical protein